MRLSTSCIDPRIGVSKYQEKIIHSLLSYQLINEFCLTTYLRYKTDEPRRIKDD